ncbi:MAG: glucosaminidase domain-containing protein [Lachnospiraceae bacterium]|nr:glucosaminidase domain-containing protein [Lachnospiraceae bacterium]
MKKSFVIITAVATTFLYTTGIAADSSVAKAGQLSAPVSSCLEYAQAVEAGKTAQVRTKTLARDLTGLPETEIAAKIGEMCRKDYQRSGILASVSAAQCILESGYLSTTAATEANNCFGMKAELSGNTWANSTWDGATTFEKETWEEYDGQVVNIMADFRSYPCIEDSIADHAAYLLGATDEGAQRYAGLKGETDYVTAINIIKNGGYATDSDYVDKICDIIQRYDLTKYDVPEQAATVTDPLYRVRKSWEDADSQLGAFTSTENAFAACKDGYHVYDGNGNEVHK